MLKWAPETRFLCTRCASTSIDNSSAAFSIFKFTANFISIKRQARIEKKLSCGWFSHFLCLEALKKASLEEKKSTSFLRKGGDIFLLHKRMNNKFQTEFFTTIMKCYFFHKYNNTFNFGFYRNDRIWSTNTQRKVIFLGP